MLNTFPYTGWDTQNLGKISLFFEITSSRSVIVSNARKFVVRVIRKQCDHVTKPIRDSIAAIAQQSIVQDRERKDREMHKLAVITEVLFNVAEYNEHVNCPENMDIAKRMIQRANVEGTSGQRIMRFVEQMAAGEANWQKFPDVLQMALNIFTKRSACFKEVKQELLQATLGSDSNEWSTKRAKFEALVLELKQRAGGGDSYVKIQNAKAITDQDVNRLKGDAERNQRLAWSVTGKTQDQRLIESDIQYVLHAAPLEVETVNEVGTNDEMGVREARVVEVLKGIGENKSVSKAVTFARALPDATLEDLFRVGAPLIHFRDLMQFIGVEPALVKFLFEHFLIEWNTEPLVSETKALKLF